MIQLIDQSLERYLRAVVPLPASVDVSFAVPDKRWGAAITKPTINLFLWDVRRDGRTAHFGTKRTSLPNGRVVTRAMDPDVAFRYLVTTWAGDPHDEHQLLGAVLRASLASSIIPPEHIVESLRVVGDMPIDVASGGRPSDFWSSLDGQLKPGLEVTVRCRVPLDPTELLIPAVGEVEVRVGVGTTRIPEPETPEPETAAEPPGLPRTATLRRRRRGTAVTSMAEERPDQGP